MLIYINNCVRAHGIFYQLCACTVCFDAYNGKGVWTRKIMRFDMQLLSILQLPQVTFAYQRCSVGGRQMSLVKLENCNY